MLENSKSIVVWAYILEGETQVIIMYIDDCAMTP